MIKRIIKRLIFRLRADYCTEDLIDLGLKVGKNFCRMHGTILDPSHCWLIRIGDNVTLAPRVHVLAHDASLVNHIGYARIGNVIIGDNVFVGADSVILPNVTIGDNSIIGANSTVSRDIPANVVAAGSPAKVICTLEDFLDKNRQLMKTNPVYGEDFTCRGNIILENKKKQFDELKGKYGFVK
jgi:maltose O-acetyltransferase